MSYTLSTSKDDASSPGATESEANVPQDVRNIFDETGEWAPSSFDHRHQFIASGVVDLPSLSRRPAASCAALFGGWRANAHRHRAERRAVHGQPRRRSRQRRRRPGAAARPAAAIPTCRAASARPSAGSTPAPSRCRRPFTFGSAPRNSVIGPGYANVDAALAKTWTLRGRGQLELRWEVFNLLNRTNFDLPNRIFGNPNFGRIFSAKNPREMQFGVRLAF